MRTLTVLLAVTFAFTVSVASLMAVVEVGARAETYKSAYENAMVKLNKRSHKRIK